MGICDKNMPIFYAIFSSNVIALNNVKLHGNKRRETPRRIPKSQFLFAANIPKSHFLRSVDLSVLV